MLPDRATPDLLLVLSRSRGCFSAAIADDKTARGVAIDSLTFLDGSDPESATPADWRRGGREALRLTESLGTWRDRFRLGGEGAAT